MSAINRQGIDKKTNGEKTREMILGTILVVSLLLNPFALFAKTSGTISAAATGQTGSLTIIENSTPNGSQDFSFTGTGTGLTNFTLDDDADGTFSNTKKFSGLKAGTYTIEQGSVNGFAPTGISCTSTLSTGVPATLSAATASVYLSEGETITCTFTNSQTASLTIINTVVNDEGGIKTPEDFKLYVDGSPVTAGDITNVTAGTHIISEMDDPNYIGTVGGDCNMYGQVTLAVGEQKTCTVTNNDTASPVTRLTVKNIVYPTTDTGLFNLLIDNAIAGTGTNVGSSGTTGSVIVTVGSHMVSQYAGTATDLNNYTTVIGGDCTANGTISITSGESKTCTITSTRNGQLTIIKKTSPASLTDFTFTKDFSGGGSFVLDDDANCTVTGCEKEGDNNQSSSMTFTGLSANTSYTVSEQETDGWYLNNIACMNDVTNLAYTDTHLSDTTLTLPLQAGASITCTFTNTMSPPNSQATRGMEFWKNHTNFTTETFTNTLNGSIMIGTSPHKGMIASTSDLLGVYYANPARGTDRTKRSSLERSRLSLLKQLVTAKLNCAAFGCSSDMEIIITNAGDVYYASDSSETLSDLTKALQTYNTSGTEISIGIFAGNPTPMKSRGIANASYWNEL